jgi:hypothetical protein
MLGGCETDAIRKETAVMAQQNDSEGLSGAADTKADATKQARLRELERRKNELETALAAPVKC